MNHNYKESTGFQVGDLVRVNETTLGGDPVYWKGKIVKIHTMGKMANIKDVNPNSSYYGDIFPRLIEPLTPWDSKDDVNV